MVPRNLFAITVTISPSLCAKAASTSRIEYFGLRLLKRAIGAKAPPNAVRDHDFRDQVGVTAEA